MVRGKKGKAAANRAANAIAQRRSDLLAEIELEKRLLAEAERANREISALEDQLVDTQESTRRTLAPEAARLRAEAEALADIQTTARTQVEAVKAAWERLGDQVIDRLGGGNEGVERFANIITSHDRILRPDEGRHLDTIAIQRIQRARGTRRTFVEGESKTSGRRPAFNGLMRQSLTDRLAPPDSPSEAWTVDQVAADKKSAAIMRSRATEVDVDSIFAWHPSRWVSFSRDDDTGMLKGLGFDTHTNPSTSDFSRTEPPELALHEGFSATTRAVSAAQDPAQNADHWTAILKSTSSTVLNRIPLPYSDRPRHSRPSDAVALKHWYSAAAIGNWLRAHEYQDKGVRVFGEIGIATAAAAPFWVPPGQISGYLDSEPLTPEDRADLRLPYPQIMLVMSDPLHIPAAGGMEAHPVEAKLDHLDLAQLDLASSPDAQGISFLEYLAAIDTLVDDAPPIGPVVALRGALVEGVVLTGDALGRPSDRFAWCLAVPGRYGGIITRVVVPALISQTTYSDQIMDMIALAAWADWHAPEVIPQRQLVRSGSDRSSPSAPRSSLADVRVLRVRRGREHSADSDGVGRTVAPHVRRGHWRRQRYGLGRAEVKRVRIAPVLVNSRRGGLAPRVYRLPPATPSTPGR